MHLLNKLECQQRSLNWNIPFILDNLVRYHHPGNLLMKVLNWFLFGKRSGKAFCLCHRNWSSLLKQASERQISSLRWAPGAAFQNPWKPDPPCLSDFLLMTLSWVGSRELAPSTMQYCSLQHRTLLLSPVPSTTGCCFCFGSIPSFFLELFLHWSPVAYWAPTDLGSSSFSILSFCLLILFMGFSRQEYWSGLPFPYPVDCILSDLTVTRPSWVAPHGMA